MIYAVVAFLLVVAVFCLALTRTSHKADQSLDKMLYRKALRRGKK